MHIAIYHIRLVHVLASYNGHKDFSQYYILRATDLGHIFPGDPKWPCFNLYRVYITD